MRQRRIKNLETKYEDYSGIIISDPVSMRGRWDERAGGKPIYLELGCGKGKFISELAAREPEHFFIAVEGNKSVMLRALEKVTDGGLENVVFVPEFVEDLTEWFSDGEASGIYLNFSDPLPKKYWYRRRLTYRDRLKTYFRVLGPDGVVKFKTDNTGLFEWSLLEIQAANLKILEITRDLHAEVMSIEDPDERAAFNIETEYEAKFSGLGEKIKRVVIGRKPQLREGDSVNKTLAAYNGRNIPETDISGSGLTILADAGLRAGAMEIFGGILPKSFTEVLRTPGSTESARLIAANYSCPGDRILVQEHHKPVYDLIAEDLGRTIECFALTDGNGEFAPEDMEYKVKKLLRNQEHLMIIFDAASCAGMPGSITGPALTELVSILCSTDQDKKIALLIDMNGTANADELFRTEEITAVDRLRSNTLAVVSGKSPAKDGGRSGQYLMCLAYSPETAEEFVRVCSFTAAASWSID